MHWRNEFLDTNRWFKSSRWHVAAYSFALAVALLPAAAVGAQPASGSWVGSWGASPVGEGIGPTTPDFANATLREIVRPSIAGKSLRLRLTNEFGTTPLRVESVHVALSAGKAATQPSSDHAVTFNGQAAISIPPGAYVVSDPVAMATQPFANLAVSIYLPQQQIGTISVHSDAQQTNYTAPGDHVADATLVSPSLQQSWYFLKGVDVEPASAGAATVVAFGDSITDGYGSTVDANTRWPDELAQRLQGNASTRDLSVLNEGIGGNRVLRDGYGPSALARFDRDVLAEAGVRFVVMIESINDIGRLAYPDQPMDAVTAPQLEQGLAQLVARAHEHGIKFFGGTITPYQGAGYYSQAGEQVRETVNQWIRTSGVFDGVVDFDKAVADPANPLQLLESEQHGDHLHPNDAGYKKMGDAIDLNLFQSTK